MEARLGVLEAGLGVLELGLGVSLAITRPTRLRFLEIAISGKIAIFECPDFFVNKSGKIRKIGFLNSWDQDKILIFLDFSIFLKYARYFRYKPSFPSSQPSKTLKIRTARSKSAGVLTYSSFGPPGTSFSPVLSPKLPFFDLWFLYKPILGPLKPCFDQLDR